MSLFSPLPSLSSALSQVFPSKPAFTERDIPSLHSKVYIVTGSNTGLGKDIAQILYSKHATVYIAARSPSRPKPPYLRPRPPGHENHLAANCLGPFLFTKLLTPLLVSTARAASNDSPDAASTARRDRDRVRVIWVSSSTAELYGVRDTGVPLANLDYHADGAVAPMARHGISKAGSYLHAVEYARWCRADGVVSLPLNPGNLRSELWRDQSLLVKVMVRLFCYPTLYGAYTGLYAALTPGLGVEESGSRVVPFGGILPMRKDLVAAGKTEHEGGNGAALKFWEWSEKQAEAYV
ncbi:hypothetical protein F5Y15DRAFT_411475 [Xylariaceae sp. FL0016]|nr:hypothetical protein F5Y15DRAFT_411475 [Xylariaceae sp. FL0016]